MTQEIGTLLMKVQLVVVQGKPEGMTIPLAIPKFKIGRGEGCQLRPNNDLVSREHAEFEVGADTVTVQDLGSRNGTDVNGKKLAPQQPQALKNGDLIKVGLLTFAISIEGIPVAKVAAPAAGPARKASSLDDVSGDEIDAWLVSDGTRPQPDRPSGVYGGDTMTLDSYNEKGKAPAPAPVATAPPAAKAPAPAPAPRPAPVAAKPEPVAEAEPEVEGDADVEAVPFEDEVVEDDGIEDLSASQAVEEAEMPEDLVDESNPFYVKKNQPGAGGPDAAAKPAYKDSSDAANDILRKMMDRRRASKS